MIKITVKTNFKPNSIRKQIERNIEKDVKRHLSASGSREQIASTGSRKFFEGLTQEESMKRFLKR